MPDALLLDRDSTPEHTTDSAPGGSLSSSPGSSMDSTIGSSADGSPAASSGQHPTQPATSLRRAANSGVIDAQLVIDGLDAFITYMLSQVFNPALVAAAVAKAKKSPAVRAMYAQLQPNTTSASIGYLRSASSTFAQDLLSSVEAAGITDATLKEASGIWRVMPQELKQDLGNRYEAIRDSYNAKVDAGEAVSVATEVAEHAAANGLRTVDYVSIYNTYKDVAAAALSSKGSTEVGASNASSAEVNDAKAVAPAAAVAKSSKRAGTASTEQAGKKKKKKSHSDEAAKVSGRQA